MRQRKLSTSDESDITKKIKGETKNGKKIRIAQDTNGYFHIIFIPGGELPPQLKGRYTRYEEAEYKLDSYLNKKKNDG